MTILGNAMKWALLMPVLGLAVAVGVALLFGLGWGIASLFTDSIEVKFAAGALVEIMGLGAAMGAATAT